MHTRFSCRPETRPIYSVKVQNGSHNKKTCNTKRRNLIAKSKFSNALDNSLFDREIIEEIQYYTTSTYSRNTLSTVWNQEIDKSMEVVDQVTDTQSSKAVKLEHKSKIMCKHAHINLKTKQGRKSQYKKSYLRSKNQRISCNKSKIYDIVLRNRVKSNICDHNEVEFKDANKEDQLSRPSSVTTLYTTCSNVINASQICDFTDKESLNKCQNSCNSITNLIQNREVIEEIDDSISRSSSIYLDQKDIKLADTKESHDLSLVSEIQSINEETSKKDIRSPKMIDSKFNIKHTKIYFTKQHDKALTKAPTKIFPKNKSKCSQNSKREFRCFNDADVVKFLDMKPPTLSYQLERGDEDEDTDEEDLDRNSKYSIFELNKALTMHLKTQLKKK